MKAPLFWKNPLSLKAKILSPLGKLYGAITVHRMNKKGVKLPVPVICIGNATLGGAGKTPTAIAIAKLLQAEGKRIVFLSRGYKSEVKQATLVTKQQTAKQVGDEPKLLSFYAETVVCKNRVEGAKLALTLKPDVLIMDDGFQNPSLHKDFSLLVIDAEMDIKNKNIFPAGNLRASLDSHLTKADAVLIIGEKPLEIHHKTIFKGAIKAISLLPNNSEVYAFCGLAEPEKFKRTLEKLKLDIQGFKTFSDHHAYTESDLQQLKAKAGNTPLITTRKDAVKINEPLLIVDIELEVTNENLLRQTLLELFRVKPL